jgi:hypothetical protein
MTVRLPWNRRRRKSRKTSLSVSFRAPATCKTMYFKKNTTLTLGNRQEANQDEGILVSSSDVIAHIPDREIHGMIFLLTSCDGDSRFVASKYGGNKECSMRISIYGDEILPVQR